MVYTGTHDNVTTEGWRQSASPEDVHYACRYLRCLPEDLTEAMICACLASVSDMAIIPMADWLHLGAEARINTPSTQGANWQWRLDTPLTSLLAEHIADLTALYDRVSGCGRPLKRSFFFSPHTKTAGPGPSFPEELVPAVSFCIIFQFSHNIFSPHPAQDVPHISTQNRFFFTKRPQYLHNSFAFWVSSLSCCFWAIML